MSGCKHVPRGALAAMMALALIPGPGAARADSAVAALPGHSRQTVEDGQRRFAAEFRKMLPLRVDSITTLIDIFSAGDTLTYVYGLPFQGAGMRDFDTKGLAVQLVKNLCAQQDVRANLSLGARYRYQYLDVDGRPFWDKVITATDCGRATRRRARGR